MESSLRAFKWDQSERSQFFRYKVKAVFVKGLFSKGEVRGNNQGGADQVLVNFINLWSSNTTRLIEIAMHHFFWDTLYFFKNRKSGRAIRFLSPDKKMHRSPEFIFFQRESLFRAVGAAIQLNSGIYLLLRRKYVRANLTHSKVAIIHGATFPTPGLPVASCHPSQGFLAHKCGNGFSKNSLCLLPRILWCVSESDKLYRRVKL